ncbi:MAG: GNAT family N-acetyltransferase [Nitrospirae bacterium]|nr:GNAT family N-acetyltransferase [Nitrospirota bacterium]
MTKDDLGMAITWADAEGWNPGDCDTATFFQTDNKGFFLGLVDDEPAACISAVSYGGEFGFIGFYIVRPEFRGNGYGLRMWNHAMSYMGQRNVGLDGVVTQEANYRKSGFTLAYRNIRFEGLAARQFRTYLNVVSLSKVQFGAVAAYDDKLFPASRPRFLNLWITEPAHICLAVIDSGQLSGFGVMRPCRKGYKIGPLYADNSEFAEILFSSLISHVPGEFVYLDTPEINPEAVRLAEKYGMTKVFETVRMYSKKEPKIEIKKLFGVTSFELG